MKYILFVNFYFKFTLPDSDPVHGSSSNPCSHFILKLNPRATTLTSPSKGSTNDGSSYHPYSHYAQKIPQH